jgi:Xaa-Pro dipeptidase
VATEDLPFPGSEYERRVARVRTIMRQRGLDAMVVSTPENIYYLSGFTNRGYYTFQALVLPAEGEPTVVIRRLEEPAVRQLSYFKRCMVWKDTDTPVEVLGTALEEAGLRGRRVGVEQSSMFLSIAAFLRLQETLGIPLLDASGIVESCRRVKSEAEIAYSRQAAHALNETMRLGLAAIRPGATENDVAAALYAGALRGGSEYMASQPYVKSGPRTGIPHATWAGRVIQPGDLVFIEVSCCVRRYSAAIIRTASVGTPAPEIQRAAAASIEGLERAIEAMRPGVTAGEVDAACRGAIERLGFGNAFLHRTAYSVGVGICPAWGEGHVMDIKPGDARRLEAGMIFHVVPALRLDDRTQVGVSETVLVTPSGGEPLGQVPRSLIVI